MGSLPLPNPPPNLLLLHATLLLPRGKEDTPSPTVRQLVGIRHNWDTVLRYKLIFKSPLKTIEFKIGK